MSFKIVVGEKYVCNNGFVWQCIGEGIDNTFWLTVQGLNIGYSIKCTKLGSIDINSYLVRPFYELKKGKTYLDNNGQPWIYSGVGAIRRGVRHKKEYASPYCMIDEKGSLYGYDHNRHGDIWLTDTEYFPIKEGELFTDDEGYTWKSVQAYANGHSCECIDPTKFKNTILMARIGVLHYDGILRITYNGKPIEKKMTRFIVEKTKTLNVDEITNLVIKTIEDRYELTPKKKEYKFINNVREHIPKKEYKFPVLCEYFSDKSYNHFIAIFKNRKDCVILASNNDLFKVGDTCEFDIDNWTPMKETFHMKNT